MASGVRMDESSYCWSLIWVAWMDDVSALYADLYLGAFKPLSFSFPFAVFLLSLFFGHEISPSMLWFFPFSNLYVNRSSRAH